MKFDIKSAPLPVAIVGALFFLGGIAAAVNFIEGLIHHHVYLDLGVLGIFIGPGLIRGSSTWRSVALIFAWIGVVVIPLLALGMILFFSNALGLPATVFSVTRPTITLFTVFLVVSEALEIWTLWVLSRYRSFFELTVIGR